VQLFRPHAATVSSASRPVSSQILLSTAGLMAASLALGWSSARADEIVACVATTAELEQAINDIKSNGDAGTIQVVQGTYDHVQLFTDQAPGPFPDRLVMLGGFTPGCGSQTLDARNTVLNLDRNYLELNNNNSSGNVDIEGFTFHGNWFEVSIDNGSGYGLFIRNNIFAMQGIPSEDLVRIVTDTGSDYVVVFQNNVVQSSGAIAAPCAVHFKAVDGTDIDDHVDLHFTNNTIASNATYNGVCLETNGVVTLHNNILVYNGNAAGGYDLLNLNQSANQTPWLLLDNTIRTGSNWPPQDPASGNNSTLDPQFVDSAHGDFHLQNTSPAINVGELVVPLDLSAVDVEGNPRVVGSRPDRGAYESNVDDTAGLHITVTSAADDVAGTAGTLRRAIINANASPGLHIIDFNIPGNCPQLIHLVAELPQITKGLIIDGYSQPSSSPNTLVLGDNARHCVLLDGGGSIPEGLVFNQASNEALSVIGLGFGGFTGDSISLLTGKGHRITGNQFNGAFSGIQMPASATHISMAGNSANSIVGGTSPGQRNVISAATKYGINVLANSSGNQIINNYIGTDASGDHALPNDVGVRIQTSANWLYYNAISGNTGNGLQIDGSAATGNLVIVNKIGTVGGLIPLQQGQDALPNGNDGIHLDNSAAGNKMIGNTIAYNGVDGVRLSAAAGQHNEISSNAIYRNGVGVLLAQGIDLTGNNAHDNDAAPGASSLPNMGLNSPVVTRAIGGRKNGEFAASLDSNPGTYTVQFFSNYPSDNCQGRKFLGSEALTIGIAVAGQNGHGATGTVRLTSSATDLVSNLRISAIVIDAGGNTSEFAACVPYVDDTIFADAFGN